GAMWLVGGGDLLLIGPADGAIAPRLDGFAHRANRPSVDGALGDVGIAPGTGAVVLLSLFAGGPAGLARLGGGGTLESRDRAPLEYSAPRGIYGRTREDNAGAIRALQPTLPPAIRAALEQADDRVWTSRGTADLRAQSFSSAYDAFRQAVTLNSQNASALT